MTAKHGVGPEVRLSGAGQEGSVGSGVRDYSANQRLAAGDLIAAQGRRLAQGAEDSVTPASEGIDLDQSASPGLRATRSSAPTIGMCI